MVRWRPLIKCRVCLCICCTYIHCVAKKVIYHLPRTVLFKIFRNQLHFQNMLQRTTACKSFKTPRCGSSSAILFLVETGTMLYVCEHEVWTTRSQLSQAQGTSWVLQGGKTFCASFCASHTAGSRRDFLCVDCVCLLLEFWVKCTRWNKRFWTLFKRRVFF